MKKFFHLIVFLCLLGFSSFLKAENIQTGADQLKRIIPLLKGKKVALVINQTSRLSNGTSLLDNLLANHVRVIRLFTPEHGLSGSADAGEPVSGYKYKQNDILITSLYGKNFKPTSTQLKGVDAVLYDIQDVGVRFYTYISTLHYVMEACAENNKQMIVLDRPDPNDFVDGPVLQRKFHSFVGMESIPVVYGMTVGELARMINGEGWLKNGEKCNLKIVSLSNWVHGQTYHLLVKPSPNLPSLQAVKLYPSLCFFEATRISIGRGTNFPFQVAGGINPGDGTFSFVPRSMPGAKNPPLKNRTCYGVDLRQINVPDRINLSFLIDFYKKTNPRKDFFTRPSFMDKLAGTDSLRLQIEKGYTEEQIRLSWQKQLRNFKALRKKYLLYKDY